MIRINDKWFLEIEDEYFKIYDNIETGSLFVFNSDQVTLEEALVSLEDKIENFNISLCKCGR